MRFYILLFMLLLNLNVVYAFVSDDPIDCDPGNPNIFPGQIEICNDNIDNNCNVDNGFLFDDNPSTGVDGNDISCCNIISAKWILDGTEVSSVADGTEITLEAKGKAACRGNTVNFEIWENEPFTDDKVPYFDSAIFLNVAGIYIAKVTWLTEWIDDGFLQGDPEYYFNASSTFVSMLSSNLAVTESSTECGDKNLDQGETCLTCAEDAGCGINQKGCNIDGVPTCVPSATFCQDPITPSDCSSSLCCFPGNLCQIVNGNPTCACNTISDGSCSLDPSCQQEDPDCCTFNKVHWSDSCVGNGQPVDLVIETSDACNNMEASFDIKEDDGILGEEDPPFEDPQKRIIENNEARRIWIAVYTNDILGNPEYFFYADIPSLIEFLHVKSEKPDLEVRPCELSIDSDCDGVSDVVDTCENTKYCAPVDDQGCTEDQANCIQDWDCSDPRAAWGECNEETGFETRDVSYCVYKGDNPACADETLLVSSRPCGETRPFPIFDSFNVLYVLIILGLYYVFRNLKLKK